MYWQISVHRKPAISSYMLYVILLTHFLEFLSCVGCPIISLNTAGENHAGIQHSWTQNSESEESIYGNLDIFIAFWSFKERTNSISIPFLENELSWGVQCHQDSLVSYCSFSFHTGVTCIDKFLYIGSQQFPVNSGCHCRLHFYSAQMSRKWVIMEMGSKSLSKYINDIPSLSTESLVSFKVYTLKSELGSELRKLMIFSACALDWFWKVLSSGIE